MSFITYPLKTTAPLPLDVIFEQFISQTYGEQAWGPIKTEIQKVSKLRGEFLFEQQNVTAANDPSCSKLGEKLIQYYKQLQFLQTKFRFEYVQQGSIKIPFQWSCSFNQKKVIATPSLIYEKASILYNLAVLYYTEGSGKMIMDSMDERKLAIQKFRFCLWCINQIKELAVSIAPEVKEVNADLCESNLDILYHTCLGNCYSILYINLLDQEKQLKSNNIASLAQEASHNYTIALSKANLLIQNGSNSIPQDHLLKVKAYLFFNTVKYIAIAGFKMSKFHQDKQEDDIKGGHIGWALGYVNNSLVSLQKALANENVMKYLDKKQQLELQDLKGQADSLYAPLNQRNQQIYKHNVPDEKGLPRSNLIEQLVVQPVEPKEMSLALTISAEGFNNFMNEDSLQLIQEIRAFAQIRSQEAEGVQKQILDMKNTAYLENYVNFFIELLTQKSQQQLPQKISEKIARFNSLGGSAKLSEFVAILKDNNKQCGLLLHNIKSKIEAEANEDAQTRNNYGNKWTRAPSQNVNKDYQTELKNLEDNFKTACAIEMDNQQRWQQNQEVLGVISKPHNELVGYFTSGSSEEQFKQQNYQQLCQLDNLNHQIDRQIASIKGQVQDINTAIRNTNYQSEVSKALSNKVSKDKILETVLQSISQMIVNLNDVITQFSSQVSEACGLALDLNQRRNIGGSGSGGNIQQSEKYSSGLNTLIELFDDCQQGMKFYQDLTSLALDLDKKVSDFVKARDIEKMNLIQMIHNDQSKIQNTGFNAPFPVYNPPPQAYGQPPQQQYNPYMNQNPYGQNPNPNYPPMPHQNQPFFQNGQFNSGGSVFVPRK